MSNTHDRTRDHRGTEDASAITQNGVPLGGTDIATYDVQLQYGRLRLANAGRLTIADTTEVVLSNYANRAVFIAGQPKSNMSFIVPNDYLYDLMFRLTLSGQNRATLQGTADLVLTDDFGRRSRIVLA